MSDPVLASAVRKAFWRMIPFALLLYTLGYLDRVNLGFAALTMNESLGLTATQFGIAAGIFFVGYVLCEVPSNIVLASVGARRWIARIMITWGFISAAMCLVTGAYSLYVLRFFLGAAEAGFFPGIIYFITLWFPVSERGRIISAFMLGQPVSSLIGAPLSTSILAGMHDFLGLQGWQWLFVLEGIPSIIAGLLCLRILTDRPRDAKWLEPEERMRLQSVVDREQRAIGHHGTDHVWRGVLSVRILLLSIVFFLIAGCIYGSVFWVPQILKAFNVSTFTVGFIAAIPYLIASIISVLWARHSDRTQDRLWHVALPPMLSAIGFLVAGIWLDTPIVALIGLSMACVGMYSTLPVFWTLPTAYLSGPAAATGLAFITSFGNLSGIIVPPSVGWIRDATGSFNAVMFALALGSFAAGVLVFFCRPPASVVSMARPAI